MNLKNPICLALDVNEPQEALAIAKELQGSIGVIKLGPRLTNLDASLVQKLSTIAPVFVDHKYYDIPSTMEAAVRSVFHAGASFATIHASAGKTALRRLAEVEGELNAQRPFRLLAVTILTSFSLEDFPSFAQTTAISQQVTSLIELCKESGIQGIVCSPHEIKDVRRQYPEAFIVTPGIRSGTDAKDDQKRTLSGAEALDAGANLLVIGRPILQAPQRSIALQNILKELR